MQNYKICYYLKRKDRKNTQLPKNCSTFAKAYELGSKDLQTRIYRKVKKLKHIINWTVWSFIALYFLIVLFINLSIGQKFIGDKVSDVLSDKLGTDVSVERVELGYLNRLILDNVVIKDQSGLNMLSVGRLSVKMDLLSLLENKINISSIQIIGAHANFYKADSITAPNYQFLVDSLSSDESSNTDPISLKINSLIVRNTSIDYDRLDKVDTLDRLDFNHLNIYDISAHVNIRNFLKDSLNINLKRLTFKERSGLDVRRLSASIEANSRKGQVKDFHLLMPNSDLGIDTLIAHYDRENIEKSITYEGCIKSSQICPSDFSCLLPFLHDFKQRLTVKCSFVGSNNNIDCSLLSISSDDSSLDIKSKGWVKNIWEKPEWFLQLYSAHIGKSIFEKLNKSVGDFPKELLHIGDLDMLGDSRRNELGSMEINANVYTDIGDVSLRFMGNLENYFSGSITTKALHVGKIIDNESLGLLSTKLDISGTSERFYAEGDISQFEYNKYNYQNISLKGNYSKGNVAGKLKIDDPNIKTIIEGNFNFDRLYSVKLVGYVKDFRPSVLNLYNNLGNTKMSADFDVDITASNINDATGYINFKNLEMISNDSVGGYYQLDNLHVNSGYDNGLHFLKIKGDMGEANINGDLDWRTLSHSFVNYIASKLPTLPNLPKPTNIAHNNFSLQLMITDADWLQKFFSIPVSFERPLTINALIDDRSHIFNVKGQLPMFTYNGSSYTGTTFDITTSVDTMKYSLSLSKNMEDDAYLDLGLIGTAVNNNILASLNWNHFTSSEPKNAISGSVNTITQLYTNNEGKAEAHIRVLPSEMFVRGTSWNIEPCDIFYSQQRLLVDRLSLNNGLHYLIVDGVASKLETDSMVVDMNQLDVSYILDLLDFHSVSFDGFATGKIYASSVFDKFKGSADLIVDQFKFESGNMGTLIARAEWNESNEQIDIEAFADNGKQSQTFIDGYVSPVREDINLDIQAIGTNIEFCQSFTKSFLHDVSGQAYGNVNLGGTLKELNLTGQVRIDGKASVTFKDDLIVLSPEAIILEDCPITDIEGHEGNVSGRINHDHLGDFTFDVDIKADNLLSYNFPDFNGDIICGTVYATGTADIHGRSGEIVINCYATPEANSSFSYNATNPDAISGQEFITWTSQGKTDVTHQKKTQINSLASSSDLYINFNIDATPDATLKVLMDSQTNDYITLNGTGGIKATYYNKGPFNMYGTYTINRGTYGITIQNIIKKNFIFQNGGTIIFGGDPFDAISTFLLNILLMAYPFLI